MLIPQVTIRIQGHSDLYTFYFNKWLSANEEVTLHGEIVSTPIYVLLPHLRVMPGNCFSTVLYSGLFCLRRRLISRNISKLTRGRAAFVAGWNRTRNIDLK